MQSKRRRNNLVWRTPSHSPAISDHEVHIWRANLRMPQHRVDHLSRLLSKPESALAKRFRFGQNRKDFIVRTAILRQILALYVHDEPSQIEIHFTAYGKPYLGRSDLSAPLFFNMSSSDGLALIGFSPSNDIGVDIERIKPLSDHESIMREYCSKNELAEFLALRIDQRQCAFFRSWVCKEALAKALGTGLAAQLVELEVTIGPDIPTEVVNMPGGPAEAAEWSLIELPVDHSYYAAMAIRMRDPSVVYWQWA